MPAGSQAATPQTINIVRVKKTTYNVSMFPEDNCKPKNRRFYPWEEETEKECCRIFRRPPRTFFHDPPTYPLFPPAPLANFDLNFKE